MRFPINFVIVSLGHVFDFQMELFALSSDCTGPEWSENPLEHEKLFAFLLLSIFAGKSIASRNRKSSFGIPQKIWNLFGRNSLANHRTDESTQRNRQNEVVIWVSVLMDRLKTFTCQISCSEFFFLPFSHEWRMTESRETWDLTLFGLSLPFVVQ